MSYITTFLPEKEDKENYNDQNNATIDVNINTITEEDYKKMSLEEITNYFNNYKKLKVFCNSLKKEASHDMIMLIKDEDNLDDMEKVKDTLLAFMKLPVTTKSKNKEIKSKYAKFRSTKYNQLMISFVIIKNKLQAKSQALNNE